MFPPFPAKPCGIKIRAARNETSSPWDETLEVTSYRVVEQKGVFAWGNPVFSSEQQEATEAHLAGFWQENCQVVKRGRTNVPRSTYIEAMWERFGLKAVYSSLTRQETIPMKHRKCRVPGHAVHFGHLSSKFLTSQFAEGNLMQKRR